MKYKIRSLYHVHGMTIFEIAKYLNITFREVKKALRDDADAM